MDFAKWCRICSVEVKCGVFLFGEEAKKSFLHSKIRRYLSITITIHDQLPKMICEDCIYKIDGFHKFATMAVKNQERMTKFVLANVKRPDRNHSSPLNSNNHVSLLHSYLTNGLSIKKEPLETNHEVTEVEVRIDPMAILQCCLDDDDSVGSENDDDERSEECVTMEGLEDVDDIFEENHNKIRHAKFKETNTDNPNDKVNGIDMDSNDKIKNFNNNLNDLEIKRIKEEVKEEMEIENLQLKEECDEVIKSECGSSQENSSDEDENENTRIIYLCSICNKNFDSEFLLQHHVQIHRYSDIKELYNFTKENMIRCISNGSSLLPLPMLLPRLYGSENMLNGIPIAPKLTSNGQYQCPICAKTITSEDNLRIHLETHRPKGQYACDICGRVFKTESNLDKHKEYHGGIQYKCDVCGRVYPTNSTLRAHSITHSDLRPHKCPLCDKTFKRNQDLKFHINQHTGARPYQCPYCPKAFASSGNCFSHRKRMHPIEVERDKERAAKIMR